MERAIIKIDDIDIKKQKLHQHKRPVSKKMYRYSESNNM